MHARRTGGRLRWKRPARVPALLGGRARAGRQPGARQARASERRFISSCVISRCSVFSALPGSDM